MEFESTLAHEKLLRLQYWLTLDKHIDSSFFDSGHPDGASMLFVPVLAIILLIFTPYILWTLFSVKWYGWFLTLILIIGLPVVLSFLLVIIWLVPIIIFSLISIFIYYFLLQLTISSWLSDSE